MRRPIRTSRAAAAVASRNMWTGIGRGVGVHCELDLTIDEHHARSDLARVPAGGLSDTTPRLIGDPRHRSSCGSNVCHQGVGRSDAGFAGRRVLIFQAQCVTRAASCPMQRHRARR